MKQTLPTIIGFALFLIGFLSLLLMGLGLNLTYLSLIDEMGNLAGLMIRIGMIITGLIILYVTRTNTRSKSSEN